MLKRALFIVLPILLWRSSFSMAADNSQAAMLVDKADPGFLERSTLQKVQAGPYKSRKSCSTVYPVPDAAKRWTKCKGGQYSQCGGPDECRCKDPDDRLTWYDCKEGSYAVCEDDSQCKEGSWLLSPQPGRRSGSLQEAALARVRDGQ